MAFRPPERQWAMPLRRQKETEMSIKVEYRIVPVTRYIVTRFSQEVADNGAGNSGSCEPRGEYLNDGVAYHVAYALCRAEHERSGEPLGSMNFIYPDIPPGVSVDPNTSRHKHL